MTPLSNPGAEASPGVRDRSGSLTALGIGVAIAMMALGSIALLGSRNDTWDQARRSASNLLLALDRDIGRNISVIDLSLRGVAEALTEPGIHEVSPSIRRHALFDRSFSAEDLGSMFVVDPQGDVLADSKSREPSRLNLRDRRYFRAHEASHNDELYISRPFESRLATGTLLMALSRRLDDANGDFAGIVVATLRLSFFRRLFETLDIGARGSISLLRSDGWILFRYPFQMSDIGIDLSKQSTNFARFKAAKSGSFVGVGLRDGIERLYTFRQVGSYPLILVVSLSTDEIFQPWRHKAMVIGSVMVLLCASAVASALLFRREMMRRAKTERALTVAAGQLSILATTDGLTGLFNRRAFDDELDRAFRSAIRNGTSLTLLMIDVDYFKRYNDAVGHVAGDEVLRTIATCIKASLRRPDDRLARYGGEEFVAILPNTDAGAVTLAETVRLAVKALAITHPASPAGTISISLGVAMTSPMIGDKPDRLLHMADRSLYLAKDDGRDCVRYIVEPRDDTTAFSTLAMTTLANHSTDARLQHG